MTGEFVVPPALSPGDSVAVLAPAAARRGEAYPDHLLEYGLDRLRGEFDLDPVVYESARRSPSWLYDHPDARVEEIERAFRDPEIRGIVATIGGNDQIRLLDRLDPSVFRSHPTRFFGTSDNTSLAAFLRETGVVSFYGGTLFTDVAEPGGLNEFAREYLRRGFFQDALGTVRPAERFSDDDLDWNDPANLARDPEYEPTDRRWFPGDGPARVTGRTWGGCLSVVNTHFVADRCLPDDPAGTVLLLETSELLPTAGEVRRQLTGIGERGYLDVGAVLVGRAKARTHAEERSAEERSAYRKRQREAVVETIRAYSDAVVVTDCSFGHTRPTAPLPIGGRVIVDADARAIRFPGQDQE